MYYNSDGSIAYTATDGEGNALSFTTVERYKEYLDAGLNTMFFQSNQGYGGTHETAKLDNYFSMITEAGIDKIILCDTRLFKLSDATYSLFDAPTTAAGNTLFNLIYGNTNAHTYAELVQIVKGYLKEYIWREGFYGLSLCDEPNYQKLSQAAYTYKAIKEAFPLAKAELEQSGVTVAINDVFVHVNLLPGYTASSVLLDASLTENQGLTQEQAYKKYLNNFLSVSGAIDLMMDSYPIYSVANGTYYLRPAHFLGIKAVAEVAGDNVTKHAVVASCEMLKADGTASVVAPSKDITYYQINSYMMFGFTSFGYHTYWSKTSSANLHTDDTAFIDRDGNKTQTYYDMQDIHAEMQAFAPTMLDYKYLGYKVSYDGSVPSHLSALVDGQSSFAKLSSVNSTNANGVVATELYNEAKGRYMYAVMNTDIPVSGSAASTVTLSFASGVTSVQVWYNGQMQTRSVTNGALALELPAGHAAYVIA